MRPVQSWVAGSAHVVDAGRADYGFMELHQAFVFRRSPDCARRRLVCLIGVERARLIG